MKFRKKPVVIEAEQFLATKQSWDKIMAMGDIRWKPGEIFGETFFIETLEGDMKVSKGDWVIKEPFPTDDRKFYPCKPGIFEATYEAADGKQKSEGGDE